VELKSKALNAESAEPTEGGRGVAVERILVSRKSGTTELERREKPLGLDSSGWSQRVGKFGLRRNA